MRKVLKIIFQYLSLNSSAKSEICCSAVDRGVLVWCIELFFCIFCLNWTLSVTKVCVLHNIGTE